MSTFSAWWTRFHKSPVPKNVTWICGTEPVLIDDAVRLIRSRVGLKAWSWFAVDALTTPEPDVWSFVFTAPPGLDENRLVIVLNADALKHPERMLALTKKRNAAGNYLILVSRDERVPKVPGPEGKPVLPPHLAGLQGKGHIIECRPFTASSVDTAVRWVCKAVPMRAGVAGHLLNRANGNLRLVRDTLAKLSVLGEEPMVSTINSMLSAQPRETFAEALVGVDKPEALKALALLPPEEYLLTVAQLYSTFRLAQKVNRLALGGASRGEIMKQAGSRAWLVPWLEDQARHYNTKRVENIDALVLEVERQLRAGAREGVMEMLVAQW